MERFDKKEIQAVSRVVESGKLSQFLKSFFGGENVQAFEKEFAAYLGSKHAISVCNGTVSLELILKALRIMPGEKDITTPLSFIATATSILSVGAIPVFVDVDPNSLCIDPVKIEEALLDPKIAEKTRAIMPVSLLGYPAEMRKILQIADEKGLFVVEDAAQALGAEYFDRKIGSLGIAGSFSLQESKTITSAGEGGMIVTDDDLVAERLFHLRNQGNVYGNATDEYLCTNARMTEIQAAFGRVQLTKIDAFNRIQRENAEYFLENLPSQLTPVYKFPLYPDVKPTYLLIPVYAPNTETRNRIVNGFAKEGISQGIPGQNVGFYRQLISEPKIMQKNALSQSTAQDCKNAIKARDRIILFDLHRWSHTLEDMKKYLGILKGLL
jgi:perosamine synthetase